MGLKINLETIDRDRFDLKPGEVHDTPAYLIVPKPTTVWDWRPGEERLRSLLVNRAGEVLSAGFPKFFNYGERPKQDGIAKHGLMAGRSIVTEKHDGTLIIRSVINGRVHFRTRGQHGLGNFQAPVMAMAEEMPWLLDPAVHRGRSVLFEYCGPDNQIVVRYGRARLICIAHVDLGSLVVAPASFSGDWAAVPLDELVKQQTRRTFAEGVVVWTPVDYGCGYILTKIKSTEYLKLHSIRTMLTEQKASAICACAEAASIEDARRAFAAIGIDWETFAVAHEMVNSYIGRRKANRDALKAIINGARGDIARSLKASAQRVGRPDLFSAAIYTATGQPERTQLALQAADIGTSVRKADHLMAEMRALRV